MGINFLIENLNIIHEDIFKQLNIHRHVYFQLSIYTQSVSIIYIGTPD